MLRFVGDLYGMERARVERRRKNCCACSTDTGRRMTDRFIQPRMQQKTALAAPLLHDPRILVLDEPRLGWIPGRHA